MQIKLTWSETDQHLNFDVINPDLAEWFVAKCHELGNQFVTADTVTDVPERSDNTLSRIEEINQAIDAVNKFMASMKQPVFAKPQDWFDQQQLNQLHKDWAVSRIQTPRLSNMLYQIDRKLFDSYQEMNCHIHLIEKSFDNSFRDQTHWRVPNPFQLSRYDWHQCHLAIRYPGHGREPFEKFLNNDQDVYYGDNCNWDNIDSFVQITLVRPYRMEPPQEFLTWCQELDLIPNTNQLPLANLTDWTSNLALARRLVTENSTIPGNCFSLDIV